MAEKAIGSGAITIPGAEAAGDLRTKYGYGMKWSSGQHTTWNGSGNFSGVLQNKPVAAGQSAHIVQEGPCEAIGNGASSNIAEGDELTMTSGGIFLKATSSDVVYAKANEALTIDAGLFSITVLAGNYVKA